MQTPFFPRLILKITLDSKTYPCLKAPTITIDGFFKKYSWFVISKLHQRFEEGFQVLFDWFTFAKDELFFDPQNPYEYSKEFFGL